MALDWGKEISFSGLRRSAPKAKAEYPSKTYINLMVSDKKTFDVRKNIPQIVLVVLVTALVLKFGVFDFYGRVSAKQAELNAQTQTLNSLQSKLVDYDAVKAEYDLYESSKLVADDMTVSATEALQLVDRYVATSANISQISLEGNTIKLNLANISLDGVGKLVSTLYSQPMVANVSVSTAATDTNDTSRETTAAMVITLRKA